MKSNPNVNLRIMKHQEKQRNRHEELIDSSVEIQDNSYKICQRETSGNFELIFPFGARSEQLATELNKFAGSASSMGA